MSRSPYRIRWYAPVQVTLAVLLAAFFVFGALTGTWATLVNAFFGLTALFVGQIRVLDIEADARARGERW